MSTQEAQTRSVLLESLRRLLRRGASGHVVNLLSKFRPADVAALFKDLNERQQLEVFAALANRDPERAALVLRELNVHSGLEILDAIGKEQRAMVMGALTPDDAAELISEMDEEGRQELLETLRSREASEIRHLLEYGEETGGRIMNPEFFAVQETVTAAEAIKALQDRGAEVEVPFYIYVVDERQHLLGVLSLRQLLLVRPGEQVSHTMTTDVVSSTTDTDQEEIARLVARYDLLAIPVVDGQHRLVGVIAIDDIIDVLKEEATEDFYRLAGTSEDERLHRSVFRAVRLRIPWLLASFAGGLLASQVINHYEGVLAKVVILGMGGNIGTQCSTIIVRGLATGRIEIRELWRVIFREVRIAMILGLIYGTLLGLGGLVLLQISPSVALLIGLSLLASMIIAALFGSALPMLLSRMGVDPAVATGPLITTSVDVMAIAIFFQLAALLVLD
ncbi:MAG: magnesium transporter [Acidobacteria bacterium]|nr:magnesium transporter [Acidobacteriota bacterium]